MPFINRLQKQKKTQNIKENKDERSKYYNTSLWKKIRKYQIENNPLCKICLDNNIITPATQVHHLVSFLSGYTEDDKMKLFTASDNLISICAKCHGELHANKQHKK